MSSASASAPEREARPAAANAQLFANIYFYINDSLPLTIRDKVHSDLITSLSLL